MGNKRFSKRQKVERSAGLIIGVILISIILVTAIIVVRQKFSGPTFEYKGYKVTKVDLKGTTVTLYVLRAPVRIYAATNLHYINLYNDPRKLEDIEVENTTREVLLDPKPRQVYLTFDPDMPYKGYVAKATTQMARILGPNGIFKFRITAAVTKSFPGLENRTITCDDSSEYDVVIEYRYANETKIFVDEHYWRCIIIQGKDKDEIVRASDKSILTLLGLN